MLVMLEVLRKHPAFGLGDFVPNDTDEEAVMAYLRITDDETVLCVNNFASAPRSARLHVPQLANTAVRDIVGGAPFPTVDDDGHLKLTLGGRGFYWSRAHTPHAARARPTTP